MSVKDSMNSADWIDVSLSMSGFEVVFNGTVDGQEIDPTSIFISQDRKNTMGTYLFLDSLPYDVLRYIYLFEKQQQQHGQSLQ